MKRVVVVYKRINGKESLEYAFGKAQMDAVSYTATKRARKEYGR